MRMLYTLLWYVALPFVPLRLWWRGRREPGYRQHIGERFGFYRRKEHERRQPVLWLHAVSLGETRAAGPLFDRLRHAYPDATLLVTHMTATGRAAGQALFGDRVVHQIEYEVRRLRWYRTPLDREATFTSDNILRRATSDQSNIDCRVRRIKIRMLICLQLFGNLFQSVN